MTLPKRIGLVALAGCVVAVILVLAEFPGARLFVGQARGWNSGAIESSLAGVRVREVDPAHAEVVFFYDLENQTDTDYQLSSGRNLVIMSRLQPNGSLSSDPQVSLGASAFVPSRNRARIALEMNHTFEWPAQRDAAAELQLRQLVADEVAGLQGFVMFDQQARYQIEFAAASPTVSSGPISTAQHQPSGPSQASPRP